MSNKAIQSMIAVACAFVSVTSTTGCSQNIISEYDANGDLRNRVVVTNYGVLTSDDVRKEEIDKDVEGYETANTNKTALAKDKIDTDAAVKEAEISADAAVQEAEINAHETPKKAKVGSQSSDISPSAGRVRG